MSRQPMHHCLLDHPCTTACWIIPAAYFTLAGCSADLAILQALPCQTGAQHRQTSMPPASQILHSRSRRQEQQQLETWSCSAASAIWSDLLRRSPWCSHACSCVAATLYHHTELQALVNLGTSTSRPSGNWRSPIRMPSWRTALLARQS